MFLVSAILCFLSGRLIPDKYRIPSIKLLLLSLPLRFFGQLVNGVAERAVDHGRAVGKRDVFGRESAAGLAFDLRDLCLAGQVHFQGHLLDNFGLPAARRACRPVRAARQEENADEAEYLVQR